MLMSTVKLRFQIQGKYRNTAYSSKGMVSFNGHPHYHTYVICLSLVVIVSSNPYSLCTSSQSSSCLPCPAQCSECSSSTQCSTCSSMYYLNTASSPNTCDPCPAYCLVCTDSSTCTSCQTPFVLQNGACEACVIENALTCSSTVSASSCAEQYFLNDNYCSSCLLNCKTCSSASTCTECVDGFYLNATVLTCNTCPTNCLTCNQYLSSICLTCANGYALNGSSSCVANTCTKSNCVYCSSNEVCGQCNQGYYWDGSVCQEGASVLCENGASGQLPTECVNSCTDQLFYRKNSTVSPFMCAPYRTALDGSGKEVEQIYYYAYNDIEELNSLTSQSLSTLNLQANGQYSYQITASSPLNFASLSSFYKIEIRLKYIASSSDISLNITSESQSESFTQSQTTTLSQSSTAKYATYSTYSVHSNNLKITPNSSVELIEIYLKLYKCPSDCLQCLNEQLCELCVDPQYMLGYACVSNCTVYYHFALNRTCLLNCPDGYYYQNNGTNQKFCQACVDPCTTCLDQTKCLSCSGSYYYYNYTCETTCPSGYYADASSNICETCISPCATCTDKSTCLSCDEGFWNGTGCTMVCYDGSYGNETNKECTACDSVCLTCTNSSTLCTSCSSTLHLHSRTCISDCPEQYYSSGSIPLSCISCVPPCLTCTSSSSCLTCSYNYLYSNSCVSECPEGYYENQISNTCSACDSSCLTCSSASFCDSCDSSKCLYQGTCVDSCPSNQWYQLTTTLSNGTTQCQCQECKYPCKTCSDESTCLSCLEGYLSSGSCETNCPTTYYGNSTLLQCVLCNASFSNCSECTSNGCTLCETSFLLFSANSSCLSACPDQYYSVNQQCSKCIAPCLTCTSFSACTSCIDSYILHSGSCIIQCPSGKYATTLNNITQCDSCASPCVYCENSSTTCTLCESGYYLYQNACYQNCSSQLTPANTFYNEAVTSTCTSCLFPCATCQGQYECLSCSIGYLNAANFSCDSCAVGTYPDNTAGVCQSCPSACVICFSETFCTACNDGYYLYQNTCTDNLTLCEQNGYYGIGRVCSLCSTPCSTCSASATNCTSCLSGYIYFEPNQCLSECPDGYFRDSSSSSCTLCSSNCTTCVSSATYCFGCASTHNLYLAEMSCTDTCPQYTYEESNICMSCKYPCLDCSSESECTSCISGVLVGTSCYSSCSSGYFSNANSVCEACTAPCSECSVVSTNCTQCADSYYLHNNECLSTCPSQTFAETESLKCIGCLGTCFECVDHINCTSCSNGLYFYISTTTNYGQCVSTCPNGYYPLDTNSTCLACRSDCSTCTNDTSCVLCNSGKVSYLGECYDECPEQMYAYQGICEQCQSPCYNCSDTTTCTSCTNDSFLLVGSAQCIEGPTCPTGYYLLDGELKCNSECPSGYYHLDSNRTCNSAGCEDDKFKGQDYFCYEQCPDNYIANAAFSCEACSGDACQDGLFYSISYEIIRDDLYVYLEFTETPVYVVSQPTLTMTPYIPYSLSTYVAASTAVQNSNLQMASTTNSYNGTQTLTFTLAPDESVSSTYLKIAFSSPLSTFSNPLQHPSSTLFLEGYDKYSEDLQEISTFALLFLGCAFIGLVKNPFLTDFSQIVFVVALTNIHHPKHLRSFLESASSAFLHGFASISQQDMEASKGKFKYVVTNGLFENAFGNILLVLVGFMVAGILYLIWKALEYFSSYSKVSAEHSQNMENPNQQRFITSGDNQKNNNEISEQKSQEESLPCSERVRQFLSFAFSDMKKFNFQFFNRFIYFNYLPIYLFSATQLTSFSTSDGVNLVSSLVSVLCLGLLSYYPFTLIAARPKFAFLTVRKIVVCFGLVLSVDHPAYCIGVLSVCNITAFLLIMSYSVEKWRRQMQAHAVLELYQFLIMIGFAIFVMIGAGNQTESREMLGYVLIFAIIFGLVVTILWQGFCLVLFILKYTTENDYIAKWIAEQDEEDSDRTDSETDNSSMKEYREKKPEGPAVDLAKQPEEPSMNEKFNQTRQGKIIQNNFSVGNLQSQQTNKVEVSPSKETNELFWNYDNDDEQSEEGQGKTRSPPKMLIRCINQFSDLDQNEKHID